MDEIWKDIPYWYGHQVSNKGRVRSVDREVNHNCGGIAIKKGKLLKPFLNRRGYYEIVTSIDNIKTHFTIHRLVATCFIPNPNNYEYVNHKDENKLNNNVENLEWCDHIYNCNYGTAIERSRIHRTNIIVRIVNNNKTIFKSSEIAAKWFNLHIATIRTRVRKGSLKDTANYKIIEIWRIANDEEVKLLGNKDMIIINNK